MSSTVVNRNKRVPIKVDRNHSTVTAMAEISRTMANDRPTASMTRSYSHNLPYSIWVVDEQGVGLLLPPEKSINNLEKGIYVKVVYRGKSDVVMDWDESRNQLDTTDKSAEQLRMAFKEWQQTDITGNKESGVTYFLPMSTFEAADSCCFLHALGLVFSVESPSALYHPYGMDCLSTNLTRDFEQNACAYQIALNDPRDRIGTLYTNINGNVYRMVPDRNTGLQEGVFVYKIGDIDSAGDNLTITFYTVEDALEKLPVFRTILAAREYGNADIRAERDYQFRKDHLALEKLKQESDLAERKAHLQHAEQSNSMQKMEYDSMLSLLKHTLAKSEKEQESVNAAEQLTIAKLKEQQKLQAEEQKLALAKEKMMHELDQYRREQELKYQSLLQEQQARERKAELELRSNQMKDYYERRSYDRKDSSEILKWLPTIIAGATGLLLLKGS